MSAELCIDPANCKLLLPPVFKLKGRTYFFLSLWINISTRVTKPTQTAAKTAIIIIPLFQLTKGKDCVIINKVLNPSG